MSKLIARNWAPQYQRTDGQLILEALGVLLGWAFFAFLAWLAIRIVLFIL